MGDIIDLRDRQRKAELTRQQNEKASLERILTQYKDPVVQKAIREGWEMGHDRALEQARDASSGHASQRVDISKQYATAETHEVRNGQTYKVNVIAGFDGRRGYVETHDSSAVRKALSKGTGDHAAHKRPESGGGPASSENIDNFNNTINQGEMNKLDNKTYARIEQGDRAFLIVRSYENPNREGFGEVRPVCITRDEAVIKPDGTSKIERISIGNFSTQSRRDAAEATAEKQANRSSPQRSDNDLAPGGDRRSDHAPTNQVEAIRETLRQQRALQGAREATSPKTQSGATHVDPTRTKPSVPSAPERSAVVINSPTPTSPPPIPPSPTPGPGSRGPIGGR
jgi:hypothetical protein